MSTLSPKKSQIKPEPSSLPFGFTRLTRTALWPHLGHRFGSSITILRLIYNKGNTKDVLFLHLRSVITIILNQHEPYYKHSKQDILGFSKGVASPDSARTRAFFLGMWKMWARLRRAHIFHIPKRARRRRAENRNTLTCEKPWQDIWRLIFKATTQAEDIKSLSQSYHNFLSCSFHYWLVYFKPLRSYVLKYLEHVMEQNMRILIKELRFSERILLPLRLFLGITFLYAGIQKLTDPQFFNPSATGFIGKRSWPLRIDRPSTMFYCMLRYLMLYSLARLLL